MSRPLARSEQIKFPEIIFTSLSSQFEPQLSHVLHQRRVHERRAPQTHPLFRRLRERAVSLAFSLAQNLLPRPSDLKPTLVRAPRLDLRLRLPSRADDHLSRVRARARRPVNRVRPTRRRRRRERRARARRRPERSPAHRARPERARARHRRHRRGRRGGVRARERPRERRRRRGRRGAARDVRERGHDFSRPPGKK